MKKGWEGQTKKTDDDSKEVAIDILDTRHEDKPKEN